MNGCKFIFALWGLLFGVDSAAQEWKQHIDSANLFKAQKKADRAISFYLKAKKDLRKDSLFTETYIQTCKSIADLFYLSLGQANNAIPVYEETREMIDKVHSSLYKDYADICNILGALYNGEGKLDTARALHLQAKEIREKLFGSTSAAYAQSCNNLGSLYRDMGQYDLAEQLLLHAKEIREKLPPARRVPAYAITCVGLANVYRDMGKYEQAEILYIEAKNVRADTLTSEHPLYAASCNILADLYYYMRRFEKAEALYLEAKQLREKAGKETYDYGQSCNNLASLYRDMGKYEKAEALALEAKAVYEKVLPEGHPSLTINLNNLGELYYAMGNYATSESFFLQARKLWEKALGKDHPYYIANSDQMTRLYRNTNETEKADDLIRETTQTKYKQLNKIFQFTSEVEKQLYLRNINGTTDEYQSFYFQKTSHSKAGQPFDLSLSNRNLILSSTQRMRQTIYTSGDAALNQTYAEWTVARQQLAKLYSRGTDVNTTQLKIVEEKADKMEKELSRSSSAFKKLQTNVSWKSIQQSLKENEIAIEFAEFQLFNDKAWTDSIFYVALLLRKNFSEPILVPLFEKNQLDSLLGRKSINESEKIKLQYTTPDFFNLIWQPVEKYLAGVTKIYFAPAGLLHKVAISALRTSGKEVLSDRYHFVQLLTTASVTDKSIAHLSASDKIFLYGAVQYDADSSSLHHATMRYNNGSLATRAVPDEQIDRDDFKFFQTLINSGPEIDGIVKAAKEKNIATISFKGAEANEESVKALNGEPSSFVLHISTHGFFYPDPKTIKWKNSDRNASMFIRSENPLFRGGLVMAGAENTWKGKPVAGIEDGILTAYEVSNMYFPKNKLVVLSACETALGDLQGSEGVYGLQRAFKMAGTQNLVMSLWKVPDDVTSEFMQLFYRYMLNNQSISDAFYQAQNTMKRKYRNQPYNWAAWILVR